MSILIWNVFRFLPYFFSTKLMLRTLFYPWRRITFDDKDAWAGNLISRGIGFTMRSSMLVAFCFTVCLYMLWAPVWYVILKIQKSIESLFPPSENPELVRQTFIANHALKKTNEGVVGEWYDKVLQYKQYKARWWEMDNLYSTPPLAKDWHYGYAKNIELFTTEVQYHRQSTLTIGREKDMEAIENALCRAQDANVLIVGEEGVGKTTIIETLAYRIDTGRGHPDLSFKILRILDIDKILATQTTESSANMLLKLLFEEATAAGNVVLVVFNFHKYAHLAEGLDMFFRSSRVQILGVTTPYLFEKSVRPQESLMKHFTVVNIAEITKQQTLALLLYGYADIEAKYHVVIPYEIMVYIVEKSAFFIQSIPFPEKSIHLLDECCIYAKEHAVNRLSEELVDIVLTNMVKSPTKITEPIKQKLLTLETALNTQVIGQKMAMAKVSEAMQRSFVLLGKRKKPIASFLFLGPTGVGKTETAKALCQKFFGGDQMLMRFDMSLYQNKTDISKLIGDPKTEEVGLLISALRQEPYGILLLDEIEKAHSGLLNIFLTLLDEAYITDNYGKKVDCRNLIIIATSNAGAVDFYTQSNTVISQTSLMTYLIERGYFAPEFLNRFDGVIGFQPLNIDMAIEIAQMVVDAQNKSIRELHGVTVQIEPGYLRQLVTETFIGSNGVRYLKQMLAEHIDTIVAKSLLTRTPQAGDVIHIQTPV